MDDRSYLCIDLKSFYASVECIERGLDAMTTNLVVADSSRTEKTICLAVSPSLKALGIPGRPRLFEVIQKINSVNNIRKNKSPDGKLTGSSCDFNELRANRALAVDYITATPRMAHYLEYSTRIYNIYLKYIAAEDIHVYSIDEVFMDITNYLGTYKMSARELAVTIIRDVLSETGITATAGIGTNMYLAKVAMDIVAKRTKADADGVRIAELDEADYRKELWEHRPLTDFWRVGRGYAKRLEDARIYTMGDIARLSLTEFGENMLFKMFGVSAEFLIDHAWGWEPCTVEDIRNYKPESKSIGSGQVLHCPYTFEKARLILKEMTELLVLDLVEKRLAANQIVITVGYDIENLKRSNGYKGETKTDHYGRKVPKHAHGTANLKNHSSSTKQIMDAALRLFDKIVDRDLLVRRINISVNGVIDEKDVNVMEKYEQMSLFADYDRFEEEKQRESTELKKERSIQEIMLKIKKQYGKNAVLKGINLEEGATGRERNRQIGGHRE